ncbi:MAG: glycine zipper family protein [Syntrophobacteraceae bacterium]
MNRWLKIFGVLAVLSTTLGCAGMTPLEQRMLSGGAIGAAGGAAIGAAAGNPAAGAAIGGAAGVVGGVIVDQVERSRDPYYHHRGY